MEMNTTRQQIAPAQIAPQEQIANRSTSNQKGFIPLILGIVILLIVVAGGAYYFGRLSVKQSTLQSQASKSEISKPQEQITPTPMDKPTNNTISVPSEQQFTLTKGQIAKIAGTGLEVEIPAFYNSPCPTGSECLWSGVGVGFEYRFNGQVQKGVNLVQAFGYQTTIVKTDYETYIDLVVKKIK